MSSLKHEIENFWSGTFGDEYTKRCSGVEIEATALRKMAWSTSRLGEIPLSALELGANRGLNLRALRLLFPNIRLSAVEINTQACELLSRSDIEVFHTSILEFTSTRTWDLVLISGVLIHIPPNELDGVYRLLGQLSAKDVLIRDYHSPVETEVQYRGHANRLWKGDFAQGFQRLNRNYQLIDYGFAYQHDPIYGYEDEYFFLFRRQVP